MKISRSPRPLRGRAHSRGPTALAAALAAVSLLGVAACTPEDITNGVGRLGVTTTAPSTPTVTPQPTSTDTPGPTSTGTPTVDPTSTVTPDPTSTVTPGPTSTVTPGPTSTTTPTTSPNPPASTTFLPFRSRTLAPSASGRYLWVSADGDDTRSGTSEAQALKTIGKAAALVQPGDTVLVKNGTYGSFGVNRGGTSTKPVTFAAAPDSDPVIKTTVDDWNGIGVAASYVVIRGFTVQGHKSASTLQFALANKGNAIARTNGNCISAMPPYNNASIHPAHIVFEQNIVKDCPGGGIVTKEADYLTIQDNVVSGTSNWTRYGSSGISILTNPATDQSTGTKNFIRRNITFDNQLFVPWQDANPPRITDGNGIIVDSLNEHSYKGRTLVENNVSYHNGGKGICIFASDNVDVVNNTTFQNLKSPEIGGGDINVGSSAGAFVAGNIGIGATGRQGLNVSPAGAGKAPNVAQDNIANEDAKFVDPAGGDFRLQSGSVAIDRVTGGKTPAVDLRGAPRPSGPKSDLGAYESR